jgi:hypothetical protein
MSEYDDDQLGQIMREGLSARADRIEGRLGAILPRRPSRRGRWLAVAAAAALVAAGVPLAWQALSDDDTRRTPSVLDLVVPADWRAESYGGVQVRVPPSWAEAYGPMPSDDSLGDGPLWCADGSDRPYVGRPVFGSDVCMVFDPEQQAPTVDSVWFGAPLPGGTRDVGAFTRVTREIGGSSITVTTRDPALGEQILSTASAVDVDANGCRTHLDGPPAADAVAGAASVPFGICLYDVAPDLSTTLVWSGAADAAAGASYVRAVDDARAAGGEVAGCRRAPAGQWVALGVAGPLDESGGPAVRWDVVDFACKKLLSTDGDAPLIRADVRPWSSDGVRAYVTGPVSGDWSGLFRGMLG